MALFGPPNIDRLVARQDIPGLIRATEYDRDDAIRLQAVEALGLMPDEQSLAPLIRRLVDPGPEVRSAAARSLGQIGDPRAVDALASVVEGEDEEASPAALQALGAIGTAEVVPTLILALSDENLVDVAVEALGRTGAPAVGALMKLLGGKDETMQALAGRALHAMPPRVALDLAPQVGDRSSMERFLIARALGEIGSPEAISVLVSALGTTDLQLQPHVMSALARIGSAATPALIAALESDSRLQQRAAIDALARIGDPEAAGPLARVIAGNNPVLRDLATQALARIPDEAALESIRSLLDQDNWTARRQVATALGLAGRRDGIPMLVPLLADENQAVRRAAAASLNQLGWRPTDDTDAVSAASYAVSLGRWNRIESYGEDAVRPILSFLMDNAWEQRRDPTEVLVKIGEPSVEPLIEALSSPDRGLRHSAAYALGRIGDPRAVQPLIETMGDTIDDVRAAAARSLGLLGDVAAVPVLGEHLTDVVAVRGPSAGALVRLGEVGTPLLLEALESEDPGVRAIVADELGNTASSEAVDALITRLTDEAQPVRQAAIRGLVHLDDLAIEPLYNQLDAEDMLVRVSTAAILGDIARPEVVPALYTLIRDKEEAVRLAAATALETVWVKRAAKAEPLDDVLAMYVMTFTDAPDDDELQSWLVSEAFGDLTRARPDLQKIHTRIMVDQTRLHESYEAAGNYEYAYGPMYNRFTSWVEAEGGVIEELETRLYHREITTAEQPSTTSVVFLYYAGDPDKEPEAKEGDGSVGGEDSVLQDAAGGEAPKPEAEA